MTHKILKKVNAYYTEKIIQYGPKAQGVDWNSKESQYIRFQQLAKILPEKFSVIDFGCGYGEFYKFLSTQGRKFTYTGYDISEAMIQAAQNQFRKKNSCFCTDLKKLKPADYVVASGIFNVKMDVTKTHWKNYILKTLKILDQLAINGFAFNMLTSYSDKPKMRPNLYYGDPLFFFDLCKRVYAKNIALLHDYGLYEFTILVRKVL